MKQPFLLSLVCLYSHTLLSQSILNLTNEILFDKQHNIELKSNVELIHQSQDGFVDDSSFIKIIEADRVYNFYDTTKTPRYFTKEVYQLKSGGKLRIDVVFDSIILLQEFQGETIIRRGEVRIDSTAYLIYESPVMYSDINGIDSLVIDTFQHVFPEGFWYNKMNETELERGNFKKGKKQGVWEIQSQYGTHFGLKAVTKEQLYENDQLVSEKEIGYIQPTDQQLMKQLLTKEWYNTRNYTYEIDGRHFYGFSIKKDNRSQRVTYLDYLKLNEDGSYIEKSYHYCGNCVKKPIESSWSFRNGNELILDGYLYNIEYISETELLLEICPVIKN